MTHRPIDGQAISYAYDDDAQLTQAGQLVLTRDPGLGRLESATLGETTSTYGYSDFGELTSLDYRHDPQERTRC